MARWVKCTTSDDRAIHVNVELAATVARNAQNNLTFIAFAGDEEAVKVKESVEVILKAATE